MNSKKYTDNQIIEGIRNSDREIMIYVTEEFGPKIRSLVARKFYRKVDPRDLFQETFLAVFNNIQCEKFPKKETENDLRSYFISIAHNKAIDEIRKIPEGKEKKLATYQEPDDHSDVEKKILKLRVCMEKLSDKLKKVISFYMDGISHKEIGQQLDCTEAYAKKLRFKAMLGLRLCMNIDNHK